MSERQLRETVPMDVLEHRDGTWEIVYGPIWISPPQYILTSLDQLAEAIATEISS